jgi:hypothetical protein
MLERGVIANVEGGGGPMWSVELGGGEVLAFDADDVAHYLEPGSEAAYVRGSAQREQGRIVSVTVSLEEWPPVYKIEIIWGRKVDTVRECFISRSAQAAHISNAGAASLRGSGACLRTAMGIWSVRETRLSQSQCRF